MNFKKITWLLLGMLTLSACGGQKDFSPEDEDGLQLANQVAIFESKDSQKQWILTAEAVDFADLQNATLKNPKLLLKKDGKDSAQVTGDLGSFDYAQKLVSIEGHAKINSLTHDAVLTTDRFFYDIDKDRIWSDDKTVIVRNHAKVTARGGVETNSKLSKIELKKQATRLPSNVRELKK